MTKPFRRNSLIVTVPLLAIAVVWALVVFLPVQKAIGRLDTEASQMREYCDRSTSLLPVLQRTRREVAERRKRITHWDKTSPSRQDLSSLLGRITSLARSSGLRTTHFDPEPIVAYDRIAKVPVGMGLTGPFPSLFAFLKKLEAMPQSIWIEKVKFGKEGMNGSNVSCVVDMAVFMDNPKDSDQANHLDIR